MDIIEEGDHVEQLLTKAAEYLIHEDMVEECTDVTIQKVAGHINSASDVVNLIIFPKLCTSSFIGNSEQQVQQIKPRRHRGIRTTR